MLASLFTLTMLGIAGYLATIDLGLGGQCTLGLTIIATLIIIKPLERLHFTRMLAIALAAFASFRYVYWRIFFTLPTDNWMMQGLGAVLMAAELYGVWIYTASSYISLRPVNRKSAPLPADPSRWPSVDILVPSFDESWDVVGTTLFACQSIRWPHDRVRVVLCDDGGTLERQRGSDHVKAEAAIRRHEEFKQKCAEIGVVYITREKNVGAKAGNLNHAMRTLANPAQLVAIFDADHVPTMDFLERTVGFFLEDERCALAQTPHNFVTPDPVEKNLGIFRESPTEADLFYSAIQPGLDMHNATFFCGSAAVLRREALDEINLIQEETVTEDAHTSLELQNKGWNSVYLPRPMVAGLQPASFTSFVRQRMRWAQGMIQIFRLHNPLIKGLFSGGRLTVTQRMCYAANSGFWFFPFARVAFLLSPIPYLVFGLQIFKATTTEFLVYAGPHLIASIIMTDILHGRFRRPFVSELYELALSLYTFPAVLSAMISPRRPSFSVTAKDEQLDRDFMSPLAKPFIGLLGILLLSFAIGVWRAAVNPRDMDAITVVLIWNAFNIFLLLGAIGAMYELRHRRTSPRIAKDIPADITAGSARFQTRITDASIGGLAIAGESIGISMKAGDTIGVHFQAIDGTPIAADCEVRHRRNDGSYGLKFVTPTADIRRAIVNLAFGSSEAWVAETERRTKRLGLLRGIAFFFRISLVHGVSALGRSIFTSN